MQAKFVKNGLNLTATGIVTSFFTALKMSRYVFSTFSAGCAAAVGM